MDLCLPDDWEHRLATMFRDDIGPPPKPSPKPGFVCGLRDWHTTFPDNPPAPRTSPVSPATLKRPEVVKAPFFERSRLE